MRIKLFALLLVLISSSTQASARQFYFKKYQVNSGLSHNSVWCVMQDSYGFVWLGTNDGLNRFDGNNFLIYKNNITDTLSLGNNFVKSLCENEGKEIWVGTNKGIFIFDYNTQSFTPFSKKTSFGVSISSEVRKISQGKNGLIWIATIGQGLFIYNKKTNTLIQDSRRTSFIWDMDIDNLGRCYTSVHQGGIICYDPNGKYIETYEALLKHGINTQINAICCTNDKIWFSTSPGTISCMSYRTAEVQHSTITQSNSNTIRCITKYSDSELMIGSNDGLYLFDIMTKKSTRIGTSPEARSLSDQSIWAIMQDREGGHWITTVLGGVNYLTPQTKNFNCYYPQTYENRVVGRVVNRFCEDSDRNIWIGSHDCLQRMDNATQELEVIKINTKSNYDIRALLIDNDNLWIGTYGDGLKVMNLRTRKVTEYRHEQQKLNALSNNNIQALYKDKQGTIYIGTAWGLCKYNPEGNNFETINHIGTMTSISCIIEDSDNNLWISTHGSGTFRLEIERRVWHHYGYEQHNPSSINTNSVISFFVDSKNKLWLGTDGVGLVSYDREKDSFLSFDPTNTILPNQVIYSIEQDNSGNLWLGTNAALIKVNPEQKENIKLFTQGNGLQSNQFSSGASLKASDGTFYFGGINGFNTFYPDEFIENSYIPPVYIIGMDIYDRNNHSHIIKKDLQTPIHLNKKLTLPYNQNQLEIEFAVLSYEDVDHNLCCYKLEGYDNEWVFSKNGQASYANLPSGSYKLHVKGANNDGKWSQINTLNIVISPPLWRSTMAYLIYIILIIVAIAQLRKRARKITDEKISRKFEQYNIKMEKQVYQSKINFFVNLVHEIRTPLSLIKLPLDRITESPGLSTNTQKYLSIINKNIDYLLNIVNQLLDFQKTEQKKAPMHPTHDNLNTLLKEIYEQFGNYLEIKSIDLQLSLPENEREIMIDSTIIRKIMVNLMSNAIKYTNSLISIELRYTDDSFVISVIDDGPGVVDNEKENLFKPFYQIENSNSNGTGIGLAFSRLLADNHNGTIIVEDNQYGGATFKLTIPIEEATEQPNNTISDLIIDIKEQSSDSQSNDISFKSCRIMVVEDNIDLLTLMNELLGHSFEIVTAQEGEQALNLLDRQNIDIIISDVMMPGMDGLELCRRVKNDINLSHIPIILLTAKATMEAKLEGMQYGADVYIEKPFSIKHLEYQIKNLLKLRLSFQKMALTIPTQVSNPPDSFNREREFLSKLQQEIYNYISEPNFSIDYLAESMFMSRSNFYRKIKMLTGMAPNDYLKVIRLNKAAKLLLEDNTRIVDIYEQVGFNSSSYFAKCFKAQFGVLPKDYPNSMNKSKTDKAE